MVILWVTNCKRYQVNQINIFITIKNSYFYSYTPQKSRHSMSLPKKMQGYSSSQASNVFTFNNLLEITS